MRRFNQAIFVSTLAAFISTSAMSGAPIVYPARNQTPEQQKKDEGECNAWAKQSTGVDPVVLASTPTTVAPPPAAAPAGRPANSGGRLSGDQAAVRLAGLAECPGAFAEQHLRRA